MVPTVTSSKIQLYADDSQCIKDIHCSLDCDLLQNDLDTLTEWSSTWNMQFNVAKCALMRFGKVVQDTSYSISDSTITQVSEHKDVGVILTPNLSFSAHLRHILAKAHRSLGLLRRVLPPHSSPVLKRSLYLTLVRSNLVHCSQIWRPYLIKDLKLLESLQRKASKFILNDYEMDYKQRLLKLQLLPLTLWLEIRDIMLFISLVQFPPDNFDLSDYVQFTTSITRSSTRLSIRSVSKHVPRLNSTKNYYFNRIVPIWNSLPPLDLSLSYTSLRKMVYAFYWEYFVTNYILDVPCSWSRVCRCSNCTS